jgi:methionine transaminase
VYEHIVFDGAQHNSMARYPELKDRSFIVASFGKLAHATGWKVGYCMAPEYLMKEFRKIHQFMVFAVNAPTQHALTHYLGNEDTYKGLSAFFQEKRDHFRNGLQQSRFELLPCLGSYFQTVSYKAISNEKDTELVLRITREFGVAAIPVSAFYSAGIDHHVIRFCFAKKQDTLDRALERLIKI